MSNMPMGEDANSSAVSKLNYAERLQVMIMQVKAMDGSDSVE